MTAGKPLDTSSGDLHADRRADYAEMLQADGQFAAASEVMLGALELAPSWAFGWFRLGEMQEAAGNGDAAAQAWRAAQGLDAADHAGAALKLALLGAAPQPEHPPSAFVETLFDQYAGKFDRALVDGLRYRAPDLLFQAIQSRREQSFSLAIDLGCGTGLMGERLRPICRKLVGFDISAAMLAQARNKNVYDELGKADLQELPFASEPADLVTAADVFMYCGRLDGIFAGVAAMLEGGGLFAFSVEALSEGQAFRLRETRRYAHGEDYIRLELAKAGLALRSLERETIREDRGAPVEGMIVTALKE